MEWQNPLFFTILIASFTAFLFLFMVLIIWQGKKYIEKVKKEEATKLQMTKDYQRKIAKATISSMEKERKRMAADLHDDLIGHLRRIQLMNKDASLKAELKSVIDIARDISHDLMPPMLEQLPMKELIAYQTYPLKEHYSLALQVDETATISSEVKLHLFRILQELINNIIKHAQASSISIDFTNTQQGLSLVVKDDGVGLPTKNNSGLGLQNIEMRCQLIRSNYRFGANSPKGTKFELIKNI